MVVAVSPAPPGGVRGGGGKEGVGMARASARTHQKAVSHRKHVITPSMYLGRNNPTAWPNMTTCFCGDFIIHLLVARADLYLFLLIHQQKG